MTKIFIYATLILALISLAAGWILARYWSMGLVFLGAVPVSIFLVIRKFRPLLTLLLVITVFAAGIGLWARIDHYLALTSVICILAAWDLDDFSTRLVFASSEDNPRMIEQKHLIQVGLVLLIGVSISLLSHFIHYVFSFEWVLLLAILAFYGIGVMVNGMRLVE